MRVVWQLPDNTQTETQVPDIEQLMFLLRLVQEVTVHGESYHIQGSRLVIEDEQVSVRVTLLHI